MEKRHISISIRFESEMYNEVKKHARKQERSFSSMVRLVLKDWLFEKSKAEFIRKSG